MVHMERVAREALLKNSESENFTYELKSIVIHRGGAYGGHYWAYVKDDINEGQWNLEKNIEKKSEPEEVLRKKFNVKEHMTELEK